MQKNIKIKTVAIVLTLFIISFLGESCSSIPNKITLFSPAPPILYKAVIAGSGIVGLYWSEPTFGGSSTAGITYEIYMTKSVNVPLQKIASSTTCFGYATGLNIDTIYWFAVRANYNGAESQFSNMISMTTWPTYTITNSEPMAIAIDNNNNVWVTGVSLENNIYLTGLTPTGTIIGNYPLGNNQTFFPGDIAIDAQDHLLITNLSGNYIIKIGQTGNIIGEYTVGNNPYGIAIAHSGNIWVNSANNVVTNLTSNGSIIGTYSGGGPLGGIVIDANGNIWTVNEGDATVTALTPTGSVIGTYSVGNQPTGIAIDANGNVWVANSGDATVTELNPTGTVIGTINSYAYTPGTPQFLGGIAIDGSGNIWVTPPIISSSNFVIELVGVAKGPQYFPYTGPQWP